MIKVQNLSKSYGLLKAVDSISFNVRHGETLILLGTSGCGKTTTLRMLNRLIEPSKGSIELNGRDITTEQSEKLRRGIGYVLQDNGLFPHYTVAENIAIVPKLLKWDKQKINKRSGELLEKLSLPASQFLNVYPEQLSGGQQQRVGLARALMANPPVLLMDEPLGSLDPVTRAAIRKEFNALDELKGKTIVMVTHDIAEAFELGDRICLMDQGKIIQIGTPYELLFHPENNFVKDFFKEQRFQLELKTLTIADIWNFIPEQDETAATLYNNSDTDIWEALSLLVESENNLILINNPLLGSSKACGYKEIMTAYSEFKNTKNE
ncbi:ABC transporter ATP-binding protein [Daejeonella oryzae]|uniref:ABC transporter ATP-binding protein n=1 Tax=Daejeonella oryzae TaxID=1122943 RepID=UPI0003FF3194|nr:ABC transporter ATP-binding protein [Daejeonella oryzae]